MLLTPSTAGSKVVNTELSSFNTLITASVASFKVMSAATSKVNACPTLITAGSLDFVAELNKGATKSEIKTESCLESVFETPSNLKLNLASKFLFPSVVNPV